MNEKRTLRELGLSTKEAEVYLALYRLGSATAYKVAQQTSLKRPTVYVILDELRQKDLVNKLPLAKAQVFRARPLDEFLANKERYLDRGFKLADELRVMQAPPETEILHYEGVDGITQALQHKLQILNGATASAIMGPLTDSELMPAFSKWHEQVQGFTSFHFRALVSGTKVAEQYPALKQFSEDAGYVETRTLAHTKLPKDFSFEVVARQTTVEFLRIVADKSQHATIIQTPEVARGFLLLFDSLWDQAAPVEL